MSYSAAWCIAARSLRCTKCGATACCACSCGATYVGEHHRWTMPVEPPPGKESALDRAVAAVTAHPEQSNRAIAAEIGVGYETVRRARAAAKVAAHDGSLDGSVESCIGRDGRRRKVSTGSEVAK